MAYIEADTRTKLINPQIKFSNWLEVHYLANGCDIYKSKDMFKSVDNIREGDL